MTEDKGASGRGAAAQPDVATEIGDRARATFDHARDDARALADKAREAAMSALDRQKAEAANHLDGLAEAFRNAADSLDRQEFSPVARYAGLAAESLGSIAEALNDQDLPTLLGSARDLARRQPALFVGGAVALGFGLARFLKSSGQGLEPELETPLPAKRKARPHTDEDATPRPARSPRTPGSPAKPRGRTRTRASTNRDKRARWCGPCRTTLFGASMSRTAPAGSQ